MWIYIVLALGCSSLFAVAILLATKNGSKAAQLEALKAELKKRAEEQRRAQQVTDNVRNMSDSTVRERLQNISGK